MVTGWQKKREKKNDSNAICRHVEGLQKYILGTWVKANASRNLSLHFENEE